MFKKYQRIFSVLIVIGAIIVVLARCMNASSQIPPDIRGPEFAGAATCVKCHAEVSKSFVHNAHGLSSKPAGRSNLESLLTGDSTVFDFNAHMKVKVEKRDSSIYQVAFTDGKETRAQRFDLIFGSGEKAFTYAYWKGNKLFQLPLSYYSVLGKWANSPGFPMDVMYFDRPVASRCLECHSTFVKTKTTQSGALQMDEEMEKGSLLYGIDCERCHGPARQHVVFHLENPEEKKAKFITNYQTLSRKQKMDACGSCHSGNKVLPQRSIFGYQPGDDLDAYYVRDFISFGEAETDVHGNQSGRLSSSNCYRKSKDMTCQSCHNSHESIKGNMAIYSQRCMSCHQQTKHSKETLAKGILKDNCIDCHMPKEPSKVISFQSAGKGQLSPYMLRSHHIGIYPK